MYSLAQTSCPRLSRASTSWLRSKAWMAGTQASEATPSFGWLCPAMTAEISEDTLLQRIHRKCLLELRLSQHRRDVFELHRVIHDPGQSRNPGRRHVRPGHVFR